MKKLTAVLIIIFISTISFFLISTASAQTIEVTTKFRSAYIGTTAAVFYEEPVQQTYVDFFWKNGVWAEIWTSTGFDTKNNFGKEVDLIIGKDGKLGNFNYSTDFEYFFIQGKDVINLNGKIGKSFVEGLVAPFVKVELYSPTQTGGPQKGIMGVLGVDSNFKISPKISSIVNLQIRQDSGFFGADAGTLAQGSLRVKIALGENWSLTPGVMGFIPLSHRNDGRVAATAGEIALSYRF